MNLHEAIIKIDHIIQANTKHLNELDAAIGDGDFGSNITNGFKLLVKHQNEWKDLPIKQAMLACGKLFSFKIGGSSGQLLAISLMRIGETLDGHSVITNKILANALENAKNGIQKLGAAKPGEKTLIDAIIPAYEALRNTKHDTLDFKIAYEAALSGAENTKTMLANRGRASYLGERARKHMDPGSYAIALIFKSLI